MARHASALKAARQAAKRNEQNRQARARVKTLIKGLREAIAAKPAKKEDAKKNLQAMLNDVQRKLRKAASKNLLKRETASRQIGRLSAAVHKALNA